jgi:hypothetical protein
MSSQPNCKQRWAREKDGRMRDIRRLLRAYQEGDEEVPDLGSFHDYGLAFDYVAPDTFNDQKEGYWRYQLSWGGPSDEIRFYASGPEYKPYRITYVFMDWFDGYERKLVGNDEELALEIWDLFQELGSVEAEYNKALREI